MRSTNLSVVLVALLAAAAAAGAQPPPPEPQVRTCDSLSGSAVGATYDGSSGAAGSDVVAWTAAIYPVVAERARLIGAVDVETEVGPDGAVRKVTARPATIFIAPAAEAAACRWRFASAATPVRTIVLRFTFNTWDGAGTAPGPELAEAYHVRLWADGPLIGGGS